MCRRKAQIVGAVVLIGTALSSFYVGLVAQPTHIALRDRLTGKAVYETSFYRRMVASHLRQDALVPSNSVYFLGDSHIQGLYTGGIGVNYGIGSDTTEGLIARIPKYVSMQKAAKAFIEIGCNDREDDGVKLAENILKVVDALPLANGIHLISLLPSAGRHSRGNGAKQIANKILRDNKSNRFVFIDIYQILSDNNGDLKSCYDSGDGVHLNGEGYRILLSEIGKYL